MGKVTEITGTLTECPEPVLDVWSKAAECLQRYGATIAQVDEISPEVLQKSLAAYYVLGCVERRDNGSQFHNVSVLERQYAVTRTDVRSVAHPHVCLCTSLHKTLFSVLYYGVYTHLFNNCCRNQINDDGSIGLQYGSSKLVRFDLVPMIIIIIIWRKRKSFFNPAQYQNQELRVYTTIMV
jgi:Asp-tRNA(Asn)/Glu-tRNA(Gln) amidotransferase A subunit family amidase